MVEKSRTEGGKIAVMEYIKKMREWIGHETLFTVGCGVIIEENGKILLLNRTDEDTWCIPGGTMEIGESCEQTAKRETYEETGLDVTGLQLFGIYSGAACFVEYPNKDKVYSVQIIFTAAHYAGEFKPNDIESKEIRFFGKHELPQQLNPRQQQFILDWAQNKSFPIVN